MKQPSLFETDELPAWHAARAGYGAALERRSASRLRELDDWYRADLPRVLAERTPPFVTLDELVRVTEWKMKRGTYRARNLVLVRENGDAKVETTSREALSLVPDLRKPIARLAELGGVGPATASAVLAAHRPDLYPFFDEDVARQVPGLPPVAFTLPYYLRYAEALRARARELSPRDPNGAWTPHALADALWANAQASTTKHG
jgi:hypothetical protein